MFNKKKFDKLTYFYFVTAIFVMLLSVFSVTFAWYTKSSTKNINIKFAAPIVVSLTNETVVRQNIGGKSIPLIPGSTFGVNLGIYMEEGSSSAYVRAKMAVVVEDVYDENNELILWNDLLTVDDCIDYDNWVSVNFGTNENPDWWYVCKRSVGNQVISKEVNEKDSIPFANGNIKLTEKIDNKFANKHIEIVMYVETLQVVGVSDPLASGPEYARYHDVWGKLSAE